jgi:uncharacterized protein YukE
MAEIKLSSEELKSQAARMTSMQQQYENFFQSTVEELKSLNGNWSSLLANNFLGKITSAQKSFANISKMLEQGAKAANQSALSFENVDKILEKTDLGEKLGSIQKSSAVKSVTDAIEIQKKINRWLEKLESKMSEKQKAFFNTFKSKILETTTKDTMFEGIDEAYDIWSEIADGKYGDAFLDTIDAIGGKTIDWATEAGNAIEGGINWVGVKVKATVILAKMCIDDKNYLNKNAHYYDNVAVDYYHKNGIGSAVGVFVGEAIPAFTNVVAKGTIDVLCQTASSMIDSVVKRATYGHTDLSTMNAVMKESIGWSPGHAFNDVTKVISDVSDKGGDVMIEIGSTLGIGVENVIKATGSLVSAAGKKAGSLLGK